MSNSVIIISEDTEIYKSFERAFRHSNIEAQEWEDFGEVYEDTFGNHI